MPCDTVQRSKVSFKLEATDLNLLKKALEKLGYTVAMEKTSLRFSKEQTVGRYENGTLSATTTRSRYSTATEFDVSEVKVAYSKEVVKYAANRFGWNLTEESLTTGKLTRRF
jgi:hypothetical protein